MLAFEGQEQEGGRWARGIGRPKQNGREPRRYGDAANPPKPCRPPVTAIRLRNADPAHGKKGQAQTRPQGTASFKLENLGSITDSIA